MCVITILRKSGAERNNKTMAKQQRKLTDFFGGDSNQAKTAR
jgi:hypothetical protein